MKNYFLILLLFVILYSCRNVSEIKIQPEAANVSPSVYEKKEKKELANKEYMKRFFSNKSEWIGTTPGESEGDISKFVTKKWESSEKARAFEILPKDTFGHYSDWVYSASQQYIKPRGYIDEKDRLKDVEPFDLDVLMETSVEHRANVLFPHSVHTFWLKCDNCHPDIFIPKVNANPINMMKIINGEFCGKCHGRVAFPIVQCDRCHSSPK